jgi:hypothetical protein
MLNEIGDVVIIGEDKLMNRIKEEVIHDKPKEFS